METMQRPGVLVPPVFFLLALLAAIALHKGLPLMQLIDEPWNFIGVLFIAAGLTMAAVSAGAFARAGTAIRPFEETTVLVTHGFYRFTRNPMYLGMLLVLLGIVIVLGSVSPLLVLPFFVWVIQRRFIVHEESILEEKFGEQYREFKNRVRRWL